MLLVLSVLASLLSLPVHLFLTIPRLVLLVLVLMFVLMLVFLLF